MINYKGISNNNKVPSEEELIFIVPFNALSFRKYSTDHNSYLY